ncbi:MAG: hypothetical protein WCG06_05930 [Candidatus Omnitrophota bacterium]
MTKKIVFLLLVAGALCGEAAADAGDRETGSFGGSVVEKDWVGSKITVRSSGSFEPGGSDQVMFIIGDDAVMTSGNSAISLSDIQQGDRVQIEYERRSFAGLFVKRLRDNNLLNRH